MKQLRKSPFGIWLALALAVVCFCLVPADSAEAASKKTGYVYVSGTQDYDLAREVLAQINLERSKRGLKKLKMDQSLTTASITRAVELTIYIPETSPHKRPNGKTGNAISSKSCYEICLEGNGIFDAEAIVDSWMASPAHRKGILLKGARSAGVACLRSKNGSFYACIEFSKSTVSKKVTTTGTKTVTRKVVALNRYLKSGCFSLRGKTEMAVGDSAELTVDYQGKTKYNKIIGKVSLMAKSFTWTSNCPDVVSVSSNGILTAKKAGTAKITAKLKSNPKIKKTIRITVNE